MSNSTALRFLSHSIAAAWLCFGYYESWGTHAKEK
jgi:hypothetical protein